jgi:hypothetical protein
MRSSETANLTDVPDAAVRLTAAQKQAGVLRRTTDTLIPILLAAICLPLIGDVFLTITEPRPDALHVTQAVPIKLLAYAPALCIAAAVIVLRRVFAEYEQGRFVSERASSGFSRAGVWAITGLMLKTFIAPILVALIGGAAFSWRFDPFDIGLLVFAGFVLMIGSVLEAAAAALKAENDQIV